jgi:hypothetical protein
VSRRLVLGLSAFGPAMGTLVVLGTFPEGTDRFAWMVVNIICAVAIARTGVANAFWTGAVTGFFVGASSTLVQGLFADALASNNPWMLERFSDQPEGFDFQLFVLQLVPFIGIAGGFMTGFLSFLARRAMRYQEKQANGKTQE